MDDSELTTAQKIQKGFFGYVPDEDPKKKLVPYTNTSYAADASMQEAIRRKQKQANKMNE